MEERMAETMHKRKAELIDLIKDAKRRYMAECEPWVKELGEIAMCEPPPPIVLPDGRVYVYTGPRAVWTPDGIKAPPEWSADSPT